MNLRRFYINSLASTLEENKKELSDNDKVDFLEIIDNVLDAGDITHPHFTMFKKQLNLLLKNCKKYSKKDFHPNFVKFINEMGSFILSELNILPTEKESYWMRKVSWDLNGLVQADEIFKKPFHFIGSEEVEFDF